MLLRKYTDKSTQLGRMLSHLIIQMDSGIMCSFYSFFALLMKYKLRSYIFKFLLNYGNYAKIKELEPGILYDHAGVAIFDSCMPLNHIPGELYSLPFYFHVL